MQRPDDDRGRPGERAASQMSGGDELRLPPGADLAWRCANLRVAAEDTHRLDPTGWLAAQLLDLADLLESAEAAGWFG